MTLFLLALALSMDSFAVALSQGAAARSGPRASSALIVGVTFGATQAAMPLLGWALGEAFASSIKAVDHWIAFVLLGAIGGKMLHDAYAARRLPAAPVSSTAGWALLGAAVATSIDAAAAGVTLNAIHTSVIRACAVIGSVTLVAASGGVLLGRVLGSRAGQRAQAAGGVVLVAIGTKILIEHLFYGG